MKIVIAGAGLGGLFAASKLIAAGHKVTIYEASKCADEMRYDWHDDVHPSVFEELNVPIPEGSFPKRNWTFYIFFGESHTYCEQKPERIDWSVERRALNNVLISKIGHAKLVFGATAHRAVVNSGRVTGCEISEGGRTFLERCDLLIDSSGIFSQVRKSIEDTFGFERVNENRDVLFAYRAFYNLACKGPERDTNRVYFKHLGNRGISWCIAQATNADVLIGVAGGLTPETMGRSLADLRSRNPHVGETLLRGGIVATIPVRRPLSLFVADGYAAIGDSACMTIPMIGSGMASSMRAARILCDVLSKHGNTSAKTLWKYQVACFRMFGANNCGVDYIKNCMLDMSVQDITFMLGRGVITSGDLADGAVGEVIKLRLSSVPNRLKSGLCSLPLLVKAAGMMSRAHNAVRVAEQIPVRYDCGRIAKWRSTLHQVFGD